MVLSDKHTLFDENTNIPLLVSLEDWASRTEDEGNRGDEDHNDKEFGNSHTWYGDYHNGWIWGIVIFTLSQSNWAESTYKKIFFPSQL